MWISEPGRPESEPRADISKVSITAEIMDHRLGQLVINARAEYGATRTRLEEAEATAATFYTEHADAVGIIATHLDHIQPDLKQAAHAVIPIGH